MSDSQSWDVLVIGGGPAGSTAAALLATQGRRVLVLEQDEFPRYHVGESLIPHCYFPLERLGLIEAMNRSHFTRKYSVQFAGRSGRMSAPFYFSEHRDHPSSMSWQVVRSEFDQMLLDHARDRGAEVRIGWRAQQFMRDADGAICGVQALSPAGESVTLSAPLTLDASGRSGLAMSRLGWRVPDRKLQKMAIWTYVKGAMRDPGRDEGATTVAYVPEKGWFWYIPLPDDMVSVGVVAGTDYLFRDGRDPERIIDRELQVNPWIAAHVATGTRQGAAHKTSDFSYRAKHCATDGLVLVGDAFAFLDPVFSSGVFLALHSGCLAADAADAALTAGDTGAAAFTDYGEQFCYAIEAMRKLVYAFYDDSFSFRELFMKYPDLRSDVTDCLIGNVAHDFTRMFTAMAEFADLPPPLAHGKPDCVAL